MTWKQFKEKAEAQGVTDDTELSYIDVCELDYDDTKIAVQFGRDGKPHAIE
jgi:hypothetical protein